MLANAWYNLGKKLSGSVPSGLGLDKQLARSNGRLA